MERTDVKGCRNEPLIVALIADVNVTTIVGKVGEHDAKIDGASKKAGAETADAGWSDFGNVDGATSICQ